MISLQKFGTWCDLIITVKSQNDLDPPINRENLFFCLIIHKWDRKDQKVLEVKSLFRERQRNFKLPWKSFTPIIHNSTFGQSQLMTTEHLIVYSFQTKINILTFWRSKTHSWRWSTLTSADVGDDRHCWKVHFQFGKASVKQDRWGGSKIFPTLEQIGNFVLDTGSWGISTTHRERLMND